MGVMTCHRQTPCGVGAQVHLYKRGWLTVMGGCIASPLMVL